MGLFRRQPGLLGAVAAGLSVLVLIAALVWPYAWPTDASGAPAAASGTPSTKQVNAPQRDPLAVDLETRLANDVQPLLERFCYECHGNGKRKGGVALDGAGSIDDIMAMAEDWLTVVEVMNARLMPPENKPQPAAHDLLTIQQWVQEAADYYPADAEPDPGWYTIHRLNRSEYRNTLRDLLGIDPAEHDLAEHLPSDDTGYGFDNIADVLSMSPMQLEKYLDAAERAIELALDDSAVDTGPVRVDRLRGEGVKPNDFRAADNGAMGLYTNGQVWADHSFSYAGTYRIEVNAYGSRAEGAGPNVVIKFGDEVLDTVEVTGSQRRPQSLAYEVQTRAGRHRISLQYTNNLVTDREDRNLFIQAIRVAGPKPEELPERTAYDQVFFIQPTADDDGNRLPGVESRRRITESQAARQVIERFATRAFRRPAASSEVAALLRLYRDARGQGDGYEDAVKLALTATLVSPNFLYRSVANPRPNDPDYIYALSDYELASRLSYFLWSSMPDDRLLDLARAKRLSEPEVLRQQVERMLMDPRSDALVQNFAGQWLLLRKLDGLEMDPARFPEFDAALRDAMRTEAELFFADVLREDRSVLTFLDSDRTFLNEVLAKHYGVRGVRGDNFRPVDLPADSPRGGVLTMAATLTVTSHATRTSPVKRGDYVLSQLMGTAPPPPPPDVPPLEIATEAVGEEATLREQLAAHVADPNCAVCHKRLDPIGLAMENFSATGAWRDTEQGRPIDASGELPGGVAFNGPNELKAVMLDRGDQFVHNLAEKMLTYATGRGKEPFDRPTIQQIAAAVEQDGYRMQSLIEQVVLSDAFLKARGREPQP